jgi:hypothetical protein
MNLPCQRHKKSWNLTVFLYLKKIVIFKMSGISMAVDRSISRFFSDKDFSKKKYRLKTNQ